MKITLSTLCTCVEWNINIHVSIHCNNCHHYTRITTTRVSPLHMSPLHVCHHYTCHHYMCVITTRVITTHVSYKVPLHIAYLTYILFFCWLVTSCTFISIDLWPILSLNCSRQSSGICTWFVSGCGLVNAKMLHFLVYLQFRNKWWNSRELMIRMNRCTR